MTAFPTLNAWLTHFESADTFGIDMSLQRILSLCAQERHLAHLMSTSRQGCMGAPHSCHKLQARSATGNEA